LWGGEFNGKLREILEMRKDITTEISVHLRLRLSPDEPTRLTRADTEDDQAHAAYLKGRFEENRNTPVGYRSAIHYFEDAISRDPDYARAYAAVSRCYRLLVIPLYALTIEGAMPQAEDMARKALELDGTLAEAHTALGDIQRVFHWNLEEAEREYQRAMELDPNSPEAPYGHAFVMSALGHHDEAIVAIQRAQQLDPDNPLPRTAATLHLIWARRFDEAIEQAEATQQMYPDLPRAYERLADAYEAGELYDEAAAAWKKWQILDGVREEIVAGLSEAASSGKDTYWRWMLSYWSEKAKSQRVPKTRGISMSYAYLGEKDQALEWLEKQYEGRETELIFLNVWPGYVPLRDDPRFTDLLRHMNLAP
jgi:serine/threonine-protein kinase